MKSRRSSDDEPLPRRRKKKAKSRLGLWIGLGAGGAALIALVVVLIVVLNSNSSGSGSPGSPSVNSIVGRWERADGKIGSLRILDFGKDGVFRQIMPDGGPLEFGTYFFRGKTGTVTIGDRSRISINGKEIRSMEVELLNDNELQLRYLEVADKYRRMKVPEK